MFAESFAAIACTTSRLFRKFPTALSAIISVSLFGAPLVTKAAIFTDPTGDTFGSGTVKPDIVSVSANLSSGSVQFTVTFADNIASPSARAPNSVVGIIDLDTDQNATTTGGIGPADLVAAGFNSINALILLGTIPGPLIALGDEFAVFLVTELFNPGFVEISSMAGSTGSRGPLQGLVPIVFGPASFSLTIPLALLGNDDGILNFGISVGTSLEARGDPTDRFSNGATPASTTPASIVPEPSSFFLLGLGLLGLIGLRKCVIVENLMHESHDSITPSRL